MKHGTYQIKSDAIVRSLRDAFLVPRDHTASITRLRNSINRLPGDQLQISRTSTGVFFHVNRKYLRKSSDLLYSLARKRYCQTLLQVITLWDQRPAVSSPSYPRFLTSWNKAFGKLDQLIRDFSKGNLELERIILTPQQYAWYRGRYKKKYFSEKHAPMDLIIPQGGPVRSKSEQHIGIELDGFAVPCHYEEQLLIDVQKLVSSLEAELRARNALPQDLYTYHGRSCYWNVPSDLSWMNAPGSVWRSYDSLTDCLRLYPDYTMMLADASLLYWEHEGLMHQFSYRTNALERVEIMRQAGGIPKERIIETNEYQANEPEVLRGIIRDQILPFLWF